MNQPEQRTEKDSLGELQVPADALWGASTQRAVENFPISGLRFPRAFIAALGIIKKSAAETNAGLGLLDEGMAASIGAACDEVISGSLDRHFPLDIFQTGSGTSTNMNANEVVANRAVQLRGGRPDSREVHPNDHVNMAQSSNDVIPTAMQVAAVVAITRELLPALARLQQALEVKAGEFDGIVKTGRTHLMDATPVRLGQEFGGYAAQIQLASRRVRDTLPDLSELPLGGTAVGTGINTHPEFARRTIERISGVTGCEFREARNHFERQATRDTIVYAHGALHALAVSLSKIANDLRLLASGPRAGIAEITLPAIQPGSSIMPGKVNPVIPEAVTQVAYQVMANDLAITLAAQAGQLELNAFLPLIAHNLFQQLDLLHNGITIFIERCIRGIAARREQCQTQVEHSFGLVTAVAPYVGYEVASSVAREAAETGRSVKQVLLDRGLFTAEELEIVLAPQEMTKPGLPGAKQLKERGRTPPDRLRGPDTP